MSSPSLGHLLDPASLLDISISRPSKLGAFRLSNLASIFFLKKIPSCKTTGLRQQKRRPEALYLLAEMARFELAVRFKTHASLAKR